MFTGKTELIGILICLKISAIETARAQTKICNPRPGNGK